MGAKELEFQPLKRRTNVQNINKQKINRFYVASDNISRPIAQGGNADWSRATFDSAVTHAKQLLANDPRRECVCIVEITHIVTRQDLPIKVLKLKK
jgi:hypothetical protein